MPAIIFGEEYLDQIDKKWGKKNVTYITYSIAIIKLQLKANNFIKARARAEGIFQLLKEISDRELIYAYFLNNIGDAFREVGDYWKAKECLEESASLILKFQGEDSSEYATSLFNLASCYMSIGYFDKVSQFYQQSLKITEKKSGKNTLKYARILNNLAAFYERDGQLNKVEPLIREALAIYRNKLGESNSFFGQDSVSYATTVSFLGGYYFDVEQYDKAIEIYLQAHELMKKVADVKHPAYIGLLNHLGMTYTKKKQFAKADSLYRRALVSIRNNIGEENSNYAAYLNNLAEVNHFQKKYDAADSLFQLALQIKKRIAGNKGHSYAISLNNMGSLYTSMKRYQAADSLFKEAMQIDEMTVGKDHPGYTVSLHNYSQLQVLRQNWTLADSLLKLNLAAQLKESKLFSQFLSEYENTQAQKPFSQLFNYLATFYTQHLNRFSHAPSLLLNTALYLKGNLLQNVDLLRHRVTASGDTSLLRVFGEWQTQKRALAQLIQNPDPARLATRTELTERVEQLEKQLTRQSQSFRLLEEAQQIQWMDVQKRLKPHQAAIEFVRYALYKGLRQTDSVYYVAFVIRPGYLQPKLITLCDAKQLDAIFRPIGSSRRPVGQLYASRGSILIGGAKTAYGRRLYQLLWAPLEQHLTGVEEIYYSPDGGLHQLAFAALPLPDGRLLSDKYRLYQRFSTRTLVQEQPGTVPQPNWNTVVYGGSIFKADSAAWSMGVHQTTTTIDNRLAINSLPINLTRSNSLAYLPGTLAEASAIHRLFQNRQISSQLLTEWRANEESFKLFERSSAPQVLHVATHGFFSPARLRQKDAVTGNLYQTAENPLLRSGLLLAGAERVWMGGRPITGLEDGILTAYEVAQLNLDRTELVVLSACETGLGDVMDSEGVYGLQRAFKLAGARRLVMSLWKVPDQETSEFMIEFYRSWIQGIPVEKAFLQAQEMMRNRHRADPIKWAGFVLVE
ncbi:CHAT domain-containing protein [Larkinella terrae]